MKSRLEQLLDELLRQIDIPAMEQAMSKQYKSQIRRRWELPADYWMLLERCCGLRTVWSNDTYEALELWGLDIHRIEQFCVDSAEFFLFSIVSATI